MREILLHVLQKHFFKLRLIGEANPFHENIAIRVEKVDFGLIIKAERALEVVGAGVVGIEVGEFDFAKIFCFKPMNHGRHGAAGTSGEAEELNKLVLPGSQAHGGGVGGFERVAA